MPKLRATNVTPVQLKAIRPNAGIEALYSKDIVALLKKMNSQIIEEIAAVYEANPPKISKDATPAEALRALMAKLGKRWLRRFDEFAKQAGRKFTLRATKTADKSLQKALEKAGFSVKFQPTQAAKDVFAATLNEQVNLIKSIPQQYLAQVASIVNQSVLNGRDVGFLTKELQNQFGVTKRRAQLIARDQNSKATATITRVRQLDLGITIAKWVHSGAGKHPRPEHVAFSKGCHKGKNKGPYYDVSKGALLEGVWTWPGTEINCRCISAPVIPGLEDEE